MMRAFVTLIMMFICTSWAFIAGQAAGELKTKYEEEKDKRDSVLVAYTLCTVPAIITALLLNI